MSNKRDGITITWNSKNYYFDGLFGKYLRFCGVGVVSGGMIGAALGSVIGGTICIASPVIVGMVAVKLVKQIRLK